MDEFVARGIATHQLGALPDRFGVPIIEHVGRVAASVRPEARAVAWLHDVLERAPIDTLELRARGLTSDELLALELLTRPVSESYEVHALQIAHAVGVAGELARHVKLADLEDHVEHVRPGVSAPPYAWALRHIRAASTHETSQR